MQVPPIPPLQRIPAPPITGIPASAQPAPLYMGQLGMSMVLYGPFGGGKTSFAAQFGRCGFCIDSQEQGIRYLADRGLVPPPVFVQEFAHHHESWKKNLDFLNKVCLMDIETLVWESLTGLQTLCFLDHGRRRFATGEHPEGDFTNGNNGFYSYSKGPKNAAQFDFPDYMEAINRVLKSGKNVIVTAHSMDKQETTIFGETFQKVVPACEKEIWVKLARWASIVAYMAPKPETDRDKSRGQLKKTARPDQQRFMYTEATPFFEAKNWWGMKTSVVNCGNSGKECFNNFMQALVP